MDIKRGIERIQEDLDHLFHRTGLLPSFKWAYVTAINPVRIRYDGEADPVAGVPDVLVTELMVGDRVFCIRLFGRDIVLGLGRGGMRRVALKSHLDAWAAPDGTVAYVSSENRHYVRSAGEWHGKSDTGWIQLNGWTGSFVQATNPVHYRRIGKEVIFKGSLSNNAWEGPFTHFGVTLPEGFRPLGTERYFNLPANSINTPKRLCQIRPNGQVLLYGEGKSASWWNFDEVRFRTD